MCPIIPPVLVTALDGSYPVNDSNKKMISNVKCMNGRSSQGFLGICWFKGQSSLFTNDNSSDEVDRLNDLVKIKILKFQEDSKVTGNPLPVEVELVIRENLKVYQKRLTFIPLLFIVISGLYIAINIFIHPVVVVTSILFTFIYYDFLSGVLHIVLDNPENLKIPVLKEPCLEFQWHHHIPADISR